MLIQKRRLFDMKAPDKIYIQQDMINNIPLEQKEFDDDVEYIRKDTLMEWAKDWAERYPYSHEFQMIIDKLNSM